MSCSSGRRGWDDPRFIARALTGQSRLCAQFVLNLCDRLDGSEFQARSGCHGPAGSAPYTCPNLCHVTGWGWTVQGSIHSTPVLMVAVGTVTEAIKRGSLSLPLCLSLWSVADSDQGNEVGEIGLLLSPSPVSPAHCRPCHRDHAHPPPPAHPRTVLGSAHSPGVTWVS